jgi:SAM-dependent methyltransferase
MIKAKIKSLLDTIPAARVAKCVVDDYIQGLRFNTGQVEAGTGATHMTRSATESVAYIEEVFTDYKKYGEIDKFFGRVAEIGPGDNAGVALLMKHDGCTQVDLIDRYYSPRNLEQQKKIYEALSQKYELDYLRTKDYWDEQGFANITWQTNLPAEVYFSECAASQGEVYDFIVSRAVLEHLYDPLEALRQGISSLKPGGKMCHKIDLRDHGMFTPMHHDLLFLQVPTSIYSLMTKNSDRPNRIMVHRYRKMLEPLKNQGIIDYSLLVTHLVSVGEITPHQTFSDIDPQKQRQAINFVREHRQKLVEEFRHLDDRDLAISGVFLIIAKN